VAFSRIAGHRADLRAILAAVASGRPFAESDREFIEASVALAYYMTCDRDIRRAFGNCGAA
jgi:hypothetical protein